MGEGVARRCCARFSRLVSSTRLKLITKSDETWMGLLQSSDGSGWIFLCFARPRFVHGEQVSKSTEVLSFSTELLLNSPMIATITATFQLTERGGARPIYAPLKPRTMRTHKHTLSPGEVAAIYNADTRHCSYKNHEQK